MSESDGTYSIFAKLGIDDSGFKAGIDRATQTLSGFGIDFDKMSKKGGEFLSGFGIDIGKFAGKLGMAGGEFAVLAGATIAAGKALHELGAEFDEVNEVLAKTTGLTGDALQEMGSDFQDLLSMGVEQDIDDLSVAFAKLNVKMGLSGEELETSTKLFADFADVTGQTVAEAVDGMTDMMNKWGISMEDAPDLLDQITRAAQLSGGKASDFTAILKQNGAQLQAFGMGLTESIAMLGAFRSNGVNTETVMKGLNVALANFTKTGQDAKVALKATFDEIKNAKDPTDALNTAITIFGTKAGTEMYTAITKGKISIEDFDAALMKAGGTVENTASASDTLGDKLAVLSNSTKGMFAPLGEAFNNIEKVIVDLANIVIETLYPVFHPIFEIVEEVFNQVAAVIGSAVKLISAILANSPGFQMFVDIVKNAASNVMNMIKKIGSVIVELINIFTDIANGDWPNAWARMQLFALKFADLILTGISGMVNGAIGLINGLITGVNQVLTKVGIQGIGKIPEMSLSAMLGIDKKIEEIEKGIEERSKGTTKRLGMDAKEGTEETLSQLDAIASAKKTLLDELYQWQKKNTTDQIALYELDRQEALKKINDEANVVVEAGGKKMDISKQVAEINKYYDSQIEKYNKEMLDKKEKDDKAAAEKTAKLAEEAATRAKTLAEYEIGWRNKVTESMLDDIATERDAEIEKAKSMGASAETLAEISAFYSKKMADQAIAESEKASNEIGENAKTAAEKWAEAAKTMSDALMATFSTIEGKGSETLNQILKTGMDIGKAIAAGGKDVMADIAAVNDVLALAFKNDASAQAEMQAQLEEIAGILMDALGPILEDVVIIFKELLPIIKIVAEVLAAILSVCDPLLDVITLIVGIIERGLVVVLKVLVDVFIFVLKVVREASKALGINTKALDDAINALDKTTVSANNTSAALGKVGKAGKTSANEITSGSVGISYSLRALLTRNLEAISKSIESFKSSLDNIGSDIGKSLVDNISQGMTKTDFMLSMKKYITNMVIQAAVYTDSLKSRLAAIGAAIASGIASGMSEMDLSNIRNQLAILYSEASQASQAAINIVNSVFPEVAEKQDSTTTPSGGYATGTDYASGGWKMVGEAGPELIKIPQGSIVANSNETRSIVSSSQSKNITFAPVFNSPAVMNQQEQLYAARKLARQLAYSGVI